ncbi:50S ribosomal protein L21 [Roseivivax halodurans JCM 10272]|uniref:Large ribosomal subunit protein bL21 n=1 Tax=Roseivivax halodurans JCM 10272 TaxID=1449350 RepID=X7EAY5_9RHOB|nr:50S ribosomal protein L21 [Roseivivax halodurans]ETX13107.1 50S ribosomal protein L21 [Roseivivax halodurans JCM 10272]
MFAVMKTGGKQYTVRSGDTLRIEKLAADAGETVQFNEILMLGGDETTIGAPFVDGAAVQAEVVDQMKGEKVIHFVKRRRKHSSKRTKGHRQQLTTVRVTEILTSGGDKTGVKAAIGSGAAGAAGLGVSVHTTNREEQADMKARASEDQAQTKPTTESGVATGARDDLKQLSGVGPALEKKLNEAGINTFAQIAAWTETDLEALDETIRNKAEKEGWVAQAADLQK